MVRLTIRCIDKNVLDTLTKISDQLRGPLATLRGPEDLREWPLGLLWKLNKYRKSPALQADDCDDQHARLQPVWHPGQGAGRGDQRDEVRERERERREEKRKENKRKEKKERKRKERNKKKIKERLRIEKKRKER